MTCDDDTTTTQPSVVTVNNTTTHDNNTTTHDNQQTTPPYNTDHDLVSRPLTSKMLDSIQYHISTTENRRQGAIESILRAHDKKQL
jgi:hypothetical protein